MGSAQPGESVRKSKLSAVIATLNGYPYEFIVWGHLRALMMNAGKMFTPANERQKAGNILQRNVLQ